MFVSAENSLFSNYFAGPQVIEVVINDPAISSTTTAHGEPDVTVNGKKLRMVQATDGNWYGYFASRAQAQAADATQGATSGKGLDFGAFCSGGTSPSVFGVSFSDTNGVAIPVDAGISGTTQGTASFNACTGGPPASGTLLNHVVREAKTPNPGGGSVLFGQIGIASNAWPIIQLYDLAPTGNVVVQYNKGGGTQTTTITFDSIPLITHTLNSPSYPRGAQVLVEIQDPQLNVDPTDEDSWTFSTGTGVEKLYYQAFDENGLADADGTAGMVDLVPSLATLMFENNGKVTVNHAADGVPVTEFGDNDDQVFPSSTPIGMGVQMTFTEFAPNSGIHANFDESGNANWDIRLDADSGKSATIRYNGVTKSATVYGPNDNLLVTSDVSSSVERFNGSTGGFMGTFATGGGLSIPMGLVFGPDGNLYVASHGSDSILRYNGNTGAFMGTFVSFFNLTPQGLVFGSASVPAAPTGLTPSPDNGMVTLDWNAPDDGGGSITDYVVEFRTGANMFATFADGVSSGTTATVTGLTNNISYDFRVSAVNAIGTGAPSSVVSSTPVLVAATVSIAAGSAVPGCEESNSCLVPNPVTVNVGETVRWNNDDTAAHTITSGTVSPGPDGIFDSGLIPPGGQFDHTFASRGVFNYFDQVHPWITGQAVVLGTNGKIVFESDRDGNFEIYTMNSDGTEQTRLTNNAAKDYNPVWSPDGTKIAFTSDRDGVGILAIYSMNADGTGQTRLATSGFDENPSWSPDGNKIAFDTGRDGNPEIYIMNADGTGQTNISNDPTVDQEPAWSPDGNKIAFKSSRDGDYEIFTMNVDGSGATQLTFNAEGDQSPAWSPDGTKIAFMHGIAIGDDDIYTINSADGSGFTNISNSPTFDFNPAWSPDGTRIAFMSDRDGDFEIYSMNPDGTGLTGITNNAAFDSNPDWGTVPDTAGGGSGAPPIASAGVDQTVFEQTLVTLDGTNSRDLDGNPITFLWQQVNPAPQDDRARLLFENNVLDGTGGNDGTVTGTTTFVAGKPGLGQAFSFNGATRISLANEADFDFDRMNPFSFSTWAKFDTLGTGSALFSKFQSPTAPRGILLQKISSNLLQFAISNTATTNELVVNGNTALTSGVWYHIVFTYDGSSSPSGVKIYLNNVIQTNTIVRNNLVSTTLNNISPIIGAYGANLIPITGKMDSARFYDKELTSSEVSALFNEDVLGVSLTTPTQSTTQLTSPVVANGQTKTATFELAVTAAGDTVTDAVNVNVNPVNSAPVAVDDATSVAEDSSATTINVLSNDADADGETMTITGVTGIIASEAAVSFSSTSITFTPAPNFNGVTSFDYTIQDSRGGTDTGRVTVTITGVSDPPLANAGPSRTVNEQTTVTLDGSASSDPDGQSLTYLWTQTSGTAVTNFVGTTTARPTFTAPAVASGSQTLVFSLTVTDPNSQTSVSTVTITVNSVSVVTAHAGPDQTVNEQTTVTLDGSNSAEPNGNPLTYSWQQLVTPSDERARLLFENNLIDGTGGNDGTATPAAVAANFVAGKPGLGQAFKFLSTAGTTTRITLATPTDFDFNFNTPFSISLWENHGMTSSTAVVIGKMTSGVNSKGWYIYKTSGGSARLQFELVHSSGSKFSVATTGTPALNNNAWHHVVVTYDGNSNRNGIKIYVDGVLNAQGTSLAAGAWTAINTNAVSLGGTSAGLSRYIGHLDSVRIYPRALTSSEVTSLFSEDAVTLSGSTTVNPTFTSPVVANGQTKTATFELRVTAASGTSTDTVLVNVNPVNVAPVAVNDATSVAEDSSATTINVLSNDSDADGDTLTINGVTQGNPSGAVSFSSTSITFTPAPNFNGVTSFDYTITDGRGGSDTGTVTVTVTGNNDRPLVANDQAATGIAPITIGVLVNDIDPDGDPLTINAVTQGTQGGQVGFASNTVTYTPPNTSSGLTDTFTYTVSDGRGEFATATVTVTVNEVTVSFDSLQYGLNEAGLIEVRDASASSVTVNIRSQNGGEPAGMNLVLTEVPGHPGIFRTLNFLSFSNQIAASDPATNTLKVALDPTNTDIITVTYGNPTSDTATITPDPAAAVGTLVDTHLRLGCTIIDSDLDRLCNEWEQEVDGLVITGSLLEVPCGPGTSDSVCPSPTVPDIYLELDWMIGHEPDDGAIAQVKQAFANRGKNLHVIKDEEIFHEDSTSFPTRFDQLKLEFFGTAEERARPDAADVLELKRNAFHYGLFVHEKEGDPFSSGEAESPGNDLMISLGNFADDQGTPDQHAATLMHELGHNLDLGHGGDNTDNCKPNYLSVMSYTRQFANFNPNRPLDYSSGLLGALNENQLSEDNGIGGPATSSESIVFGTPSGARLAPADGSDINWDDVGGITPNPGTVTADINNLGIGDCEATPGQIDLHDYNDWLNLDLLEFVEGSNFYDGLHSTVVEQGFDVQAQISQLNQLNSIIQGLEDAAFDGDATTAKAILSDDIQQAIASLQTYESTRNDNALADSILNVESIQPDIENLVIEAFEAALLSIVNNIVQSLLIEAQSVQSDHSGPLARDDSPPAILEDSAATTINVLANDRHFSGDSFTIVEATDGTRGTVSITNGGADLTYTPSPNQNGIDSFSYTIEDLQGERDSAIVAIVITPRNDDPTANDDAVTILDDTVPVTIEVLVNDVDVDGDVLEVQSVTQGTKGTVANNGGDVTYTRTLGQTGVDSFDYTVDDSNGGSAAATVNIVGDADSDGIADEVDPNDTAPNDDFTDVPLGGTTSGQIISRGDQTLLITDIAPNPAGGILIETEASGSVTDATFSVCSGTATISLGAGSAVDVKCSSVSVKATIGTEDVEFKKNGVIRATATLAAGNGLTYDPNTMTITAFADNIGPVTVIIDGKEVILLPGQTAVINDPPVPANDNYSTNVNTVLIVSNPAQGILANDNDTPSDKPNLTSILVGGVRHGGLTLNPDGTFTYQPVPNFVGADSFTYRASDGSDISTGTATVTITVNPPVVILNGKKDSFLTQSLPNNNEGANAKLIVTILGTHRPVIAFDQNAIATAAAGKTLQSAKLRFYIIDNSNTWGSTGRTIDVHRLTTDWPVEGNGWNLVKGIRGSGPGVTWNCPSDTKIQNLVVDCSTKWNGGKFATKTTSVLIKNNMVGWIEFDVKADVEKFLKPTGDPGRASNFGWLIKKTDESKLGLASFASREASSNAPQLVLTFQ